MSGDGKGDATLSRRVADAVFAVLRPDEIAAASELLKDERFRVDYLRPYLAAVNRLAAMIEGRAAVPVAPAADAGAEPVEQSDDSGLQRTLSRPAATH
jgi:hypothetical protein